MENTFNIYCDESCHIYDDNQKTMVLGCLELPKTDLKAISDQVKEIKQKHNMQKMTEIKWNKVSNNKLDFYLEIIDFFLKTDALKFRCVVVPNKSLLNHEDFEQTGDLFYYKMFYLAIKDMLKSENIYNVYFDYKDRLENKEINKLESIFVRTIFKNDTTKMHMQLIHSHESQIIQITDLLIGAVGYKNREIITSTAKLAMIGLIEDSLKLKLNNTTSHNEKFNILIWRPRVTR